MLATGGVLLIAVCTVGAQDARSTPDTTVDLAAPAPADMAGLSISLPSSSSNSPMEQMEQMDPMDHTYPTNLLILSASLSTPPGSQQPALPDAPKPAAAREASTKDCKVRPCPAPIINWYKRFEDGPQVKPLTPKEKAWLATRNLVDPFNLITILGTSAISVAIDPHSPYGPGMPGFARNFGVSFTQDMIGEFFNTFLIPSIVHQDPHYHRMPHASYPRRALHAIAQVGWTQGDDGKGMLNYANLVGFAIDDEIGNLYVPGRHTDAGATAQRYAIGLATAPIDNFITEFLPDVASHVHVQIVVVQRIINRFATKDSGGF